MKFFKKSLSLLAVATLCLGFFFTNSVTASAADPVTYYIKYVPSLSEWRVQEGTWSDSVNHVGLTHVTYNIKDGDSVVIDGNANILLKLDAYLSSLTVAYTDIAVVYAKGYDNVYVLGDTIAAINGDVKNAEVYNDAVANFNNNVGKLLVSNSHTAGLSATVSVLGTADHLVGRTGTDTYFELYSFQKGSLVLENGFLKTPASQCSSIPPATTTTPSTSTNTNTNKDYDDVPKTGDNGFMNPLLLVAIAAVCAFGAYKLNK